MAASNTSGNNDNFTLNNVAAGTYTFQARQGRYVWGFKATGSGSLTIGFLLADGTSVVPLVNSTTATVNGGSVDLPNGVITVVIAGFSANYLTLQRVSYGLN